jgi:hypothetical protein
MPRISRSRRALVSARQRLSRVMAWAMVGGGLAAVVAILFR